MTVIVGIETAEGTWLGADRQGTSDQIPLYPDTKKLITLACGVKLAYTGSYRESQIVQTEAQPRRRYHDEAAVDWLLSAFVPSVYYALKKYDRMNADGTTHSAWLVAFEGALYMLSSDLSMIKLSSAAFGSGREVALGSLNHRKTRKPETRIREAIAAAAENTLYVGGAIDIEFQPRATP